MCTCEVIVEGFVDWYINLCRETWTNISEKSIELIGYCLFIMHYNISNASTCGVSLPD